MTVSLSSFAPALLSGALFAAVPAAHAIDVARARTIANGNACFGCHRVDQKMVGPSFRQIQEKYKSDPGAVANLTRKVKLGGAGVWGSIPMPSHSGMSEADAALVTQWIMAGAPDK